MEVLGAIASAVTLASLFKATVEAFDLIQLYQGHDEDLKRLQVQLKIEKCRLYVWGEVMGLTTAEDTSSNLLEHWRHSDVAAECLVGIHDLFHDADALEVKYGCFLVTANKVPDKAQGQVENCSDTVITTAFSNFKIKSRQALSIGLRTKLRKSKWIIQDRKRFAALISDVQNLITGLHNITEELSSSSRLDKQLEKRISRITNLETLNSITCACQESHPHIASAASAVADSISAGSQPILDFAAWQARVDDLPPEELSMATLEDLTITELKHAIIDLKKNQAEKEEVLNKVQMELKRSMDLLNGNLAKMAAKAAGETTSMHTVTLLTLIFLPVTFTASFFSMTEVTYDINARLSRPWDTYWSTVIPILIATMGIWYISWSKSLQSWRDRTWKPLLIRAHTNYDSKRDEKERSDSELV